MNTRELVADVRDLPGNYLVLGGYSLALIGLAGVILGLALVPASVYYGWNFWSLMSLIGFGLGLLAGLVLLASVRAAFMTLGRLRDTVLPKPEWETEDDPEPDPEPEPPARGLPINPDWDPEPDPRVFKLREEPEVESVLPPSSLTRSDINSDLAVSSSNQADEDYRTAWSIIELSFRAMAKEADGLTTDEKPWTYERCSGAKLVNKWSQWKRVLDLIEAAGVFANARGRAGWRLVPGSPDVARELLDALYTRNGYYRLNGTWLKK